MRKFEIVYLRDSADVVDREEIIADKCNVMQSGVIVFTIRSNIIKVLSSSGFVSVTPGEEVEDRPERDGGRAIEIAN